MCLQSVASLLPPLHGRVYVVSDPCRLCSLSVGQGGLRNPWRNTHTWEVIESEEMARGGKGRGDQAAGTRILYM